jgi:hypothetical protein
MTVYVGEWHDGEPDLGTIVREINEMMADPELREAAIERGRADRDDTEWRRGEEP